MGYPVTLNGRTYTLADFTGQNYVSGFPDALEDFVTDAAAKVAAAELAETNAESAQTAAEAAQTAAETAQAAAEAAQEAIDGLYLGAQASNPTVDLNGDPLTAGDWYFNTTDNNSRVYDGSSWNIIDPDLSGDASPTLGGNLNGAGYNISGVTDLTITGDLTVDTSTLVVDSTNNAVGINTVTASGPQSTFHIEQNGDDADGGFRLSRDNALASYTQYINTSSTWNLAYGNPSSDDSPTDILSVNTSGLVGIGTTPSTALHVKGADPVLTIQDNAGTLAQVEWVDSSGNTLMNMRSGGTDFVTDLEAGGSYIYRNAGSEQFRISSSGHVGIGTSSPTRRLHVEDVVGTLAQFTSTGTGGGGISFADANSTAVNNQRIRAVGNDLTFTTGGAERMRITSGGNVGIGTSSPSSYNSVADNLVVGDVSGNNGITILSGTAEQGSLFFGDGTGTSAAQGIIRYKHSTNALELGTANTGDHLVINSSGNVGIGRTPSYVLDVEGDATPIFALRSNSNTGNSLMFFGRPNDVDAGRIGYDHTNDLMYFRTAGSEAMRITSGGNVGIGESSPEHLLHAKTNTATVISSTLSTRFERNRLRIQNSNTTVGSGAGITFQSQAGSNNYWFVDILGATSYGSPLVFANRTGSTTVSERMRLDSSGNLLVGTTTTSPTTNSVVIQPSLGRVTCLTGSGGQYASFLNSSGSQIGFIANVGNSTTQYSTSSDERLKENIVDAPAGNIDAIRVRSFDWKADGSHQTYGMVAQELVDVAPEAVYQGETDEDMWGVDYSKLVPMMIKEIQDLKAEVAALKGAN